MAWRAGQADEVGPSLRLGPRPLDEYGPSPLFAQNGLPPPRLVVRARSTLTFLVVLAYSDLLMMLPIQWTQSPLLRDALAPLQVSELLPAPPIRLVRRAGLPLTPAAEYFCDMRRAVLHRDALSV